jgi:hypothetical protein
VDTLGSGEGDARRGPTFVHGRDKVGIVRHRAMNAQLRLGGGAARGRRGRSYAVPMISMETANNGLVNWSSSMALRTTRTHEHCCPVGDGGMACGSAEALPAKRAAAAQRSCFAMTLRQADHTWAMLPASVQTEEASWLDNESR